MKRSVFACAALLSLSACASDVDPGPGGGSAAPPTPCMGDDCPLDRRCVNGVCVGDAASTPSSDVRAAVAEAARRGCARLQSDCAHLCEGPFARCHPTLEACVAEETAEYLDDYASPVVDPVLAAQCAAQIEAAPCSDLTPDTLECEYAVVETCASSEDDPFGLNHSPFTPAPLELDQTHVLRLCTDAPEFYAIELEAGGRLSVTGVEEHDERVGLTLFRLLATRTGEAMLEDMSGYFAADGDLTAPVPEAGTYLLEVDASSRSGDFALRIARE